ncbi:BTAD domain-containing putative transcriptional regulator [Actinospica sp.]|uniref:BTAD domain-containing putative transcriptional regulator n=1 Tax=Actinospica sp. TaxID=1872142 RepID=UPI002B9BEE48|nr:BTAD domain-containing putative transcriptional regulator [Actinospica sp.]HWG27297.1 BTAD domain-containing putative transcriptional regulator [Actinospica sp.]
MSDIRTHGRTSGDVLRALGALLVLVVLLGAVPFALVRFIGWPLPHQVPTTDQLRSPLSSDVLVKALAVVVWLAWAQFTACVIVELSNARRGVGIPAKVPGALPSQFLARQLVAAVLMLTATAASFAPDITHLSNSPAAIPKPHTAISMQLDAAGSPPSGNGTVARNGSSTTTSSNLPSTRSGQAVVQAASSSMTQVSVQTVAGTKLYRVQPPHGRNYDSLWEIAERHLGDGRRYKEIYALNKDRIQPDGQKLTDASLIRPGWILEMPADATGGDLITEMPAMASSSTVTSSSTATTQTNNPTVQDADANAQTAVTNTGVDKSADDKGGTSADHKTDAEPGAQQAGFVFGTAATAPSKLTPANPQGVKVSQAADDIAQAVAAAARAAEASANAQQNGRQNGSESGGGAITSAGLPRNSHRGSTSADEKQLGPVEERVLYGIAGAPLLAAGLLLALGRHRRRQLWNRIGGRRPTTPTGDAAVAEESIRVGAGEVEVWFLDLALRGLSAELSKRDRALPRTSALRLRTQGIELMLTEAVDATGPEQAPLPWFTAADGRSWNFPRPAIGQIDADAAHQRFAPYPGLVSIGTAGEDGEDRLLVDLEDVPGVLAVTGPREQTRALISAMAVELATNAWSDRMSITLVGFPGDLTPLAPARVRHVKVLDEILPVLEAEAAERTSALSNAGLDSVLDSRVRASHAAAFAPHFVLVAEEPHPAILSRLIEIAPQTTRVGMGFVVAGEVPDAAGRLEVAEDGTVLESRSGIEARAQLLPEDQYAAILGLFRAVGDVEGIPLSGGAGGVARVAGVGYTGPLPDEQPSVFVRVLGQLETSGTGIAEAERAPLLNEALVFLLQHRDGVHPSVLAAALWPRGTTADVARATVERLAEWLGTDPDGEPNLISEPDGRLRLGRFVWSDWDLFESLQSRALYDANLQSPVHLDNLLNAALDLVRGRFLANRTKGRYGWLAYEIVEAQIPAQIADTALRLADARVANGAAEKAIAAVEAGLRASPEDEELWRGLLRAVFATSDVPRLEKTIASLRDRTWRVHGVRELHPLTEALIAELAPASVVQSSDAASGDQ